jgi:nucleotide-binding universal stress UspA family protein
METTTTARARQASAAFSDATPVIVCGIDDTRAAGEIVRFAADLIGREGGRLILLHVQPPPLIDVEPQIAYAAPQPSPVREQLVVARELASLAADARVTTSAEVRVAFGDLANVLLATVDAEHATLLVVGSRPGFRRESMRLVSHAPCPVAVIPLEGRDRADSVAVGGRGRLPPGEDREDRQMLVGAEPMDRARGNEHGVTLAELQQLA